jgi:hypothetical protein
MSILQKTALVVAALLLGATAAGAGTTPAHQCRAAKNKVAGKYAACRQSAEAALATSGDTTKYDAAVGKCAASFTSAWRKAEDKAAGACRDGAPTAAAFQAAIEYATTNVAHALDGAELSICTGAQGRRLKTGQTGCWDASGVAIPCEGTGQDGELQKGLTPAYADNADGTITDLRTGLVWEKLSDDGSIHDKDDVYDWDQAFTVKVATLNDDAFAGHTDWRVPNRFELESLMNLGTNDPAVTAAFDTDCASGCTVLTCSCTATTFDRIYWTSTASVGYAPYAWRVDFNSGDVISAGKGNGFYVRAVRGGS